MGSSESKTSNEIEAEAYNIIKWIPLVNIGYSVTRAAVYGGMGDHETARASAIDFGINTAGALIGGAVGGGGVLAARASTQAAFSGASVVVQGATRQMVGACIGGAAVGSGGGQLINHGTRG